MRRPIALVDGNNMYVSIERVFAPDLRNRPLVILSSNDGCAISRSNEAKSLGVEMGDPYHLNRDKWQALGIVVRSTNFELICDMAKRFVDVIRRFSPDVEVYSIDECFVDFTGFEHRLEAHARELKDEVYRLTGIPVSVGIAPTKTLAKVANKAAKKDAASGGVVILMEHDDQVAALQKIEITKLWGIKDRLAARLAGIGIRTPMDLRTADARLVKERIGVVAQRTALEIRGVRAIAFEEGVPDRKSIVVSRSFGRPIEDLEEMRQAIVSYATLAAAKLRRQGLAVGVLQVFLQTNPFKATDRQRSVGRTIEMPVATSDTGRIAGAAVAGIEAIWKSGFRYKKTGILMLDLVKASSVGDGLFDLADSAPSKSRMRAMDAINARFGRGTVGMAGALAPPAKRSGKLPWTMRRDNLSRCYTTRIDEVLVVGDAGLARKEPSR